MLQRCRTPRLAVQPTSAPYKRSYQHYRPFDKMTRTIIVIIMIRILRSTVVPMSPHPKIIPQHNR
ncbi:hypothetical protein FOQG_19573 [Fusarium oxysporum f. sp. raphani 54005]|uniref:Uncharacterized protein n=1 Tax=Fusarium oxysporum f. sp. raphani 54005 TaxID=1089458 RepID=X0B1R6_FUSOX|nr:hypothetical protein FOQG_19573 [Fusarium oxysporum f. sp. raphani 54005]